MLKTTLNFIKFLFLFRDEGGIVSLSESVSVDLTMR